MKKHHNIKQRWIICVCVCVPVCCSQRWSLKRPCLARLQPYRPVKRCCNAGKAATMSAAPGECAYAGCVLVLLCLSCSVELAVHHCSSIFYCYACWRWGSVCWCVCLFSCTPAFLIYHEHGIVKFYLQFEWFWDTEHPSFQILDSKTDVVKFFIIDCNNRNPKGTLNI